VTNLSVTQAASPYGLFLRARPVVPRWSARWAATSRENSGGAHCLKHGFTVNHVLGLEIVTPAGELTWLGDGTGRDFWL